MSLFRNPPPARWARANCPTCGEVPVMFTDIVVRVCVETRNGEYRFKCSQCGMTVLTEIVHAPLLERLIHMGFTIEYWYLPSEQFERRSELPPITADDIDDFTRELESL